MVHIAVMCHRDAKSSPAHLCYVGVICMCHADIAWSRLGLCHVLASDALHT